ncbi:hypothetical protein ACJH6J_06985 [Mycobacterium sp. SMC-18]|uniref:hypothetical protein n=1 Tax=Mycobacterium sp. SMC-18 TaxID=3381629 RepID=UPI0038766B83
MRRRGEEDRDQVPDELLVFDGDPYRTATAWQAAFDEFHDAREAWAKQHGLESSFDLPLRYVGRDCPFDPSQI